MKPEGSGRLGDHVFLGVLVSVFPPRVVDAASERASVNGQRNQLLPALMMVYFVMLLAMFFFESAK